MDAPNGSPCWGDAWCGPSGICKSDGNGVYKGNCLRPKQDGEYCDKDHDCISGSCGRPSAAPIGIPIIGPIIGWDPNTICCPTSRGGLCPWLGYDYCCNIPFLEPCLSDHQCAGKLLCLNAIVVP